MLTLKRMYLVVLNWPNAPVNLNPAKAELNKSVVKVEIMQQKNICHDKVVVQNEDTSSIENRRPPTGEPKAEATPAAAPADIKLRLKNYRTQKFKKKICRHSIRNVIFSKLIFAAPKIFQGHTIFKFTDSLPVLRSPEPLKDWEVDSEGL